MARFKLQTQHVRSKELKAPQDRSANLAAQTIKCEQK